MLLTLEVEVEVEVEMLSELNMWNYHCVIVEASPGVPHLYMLGVGVAGFFGFGCGREWSSPSLVGNAPHSAVWCNVLRRGVVWCGWHKSTN